MLRLIYIRRFFFGVLLILNAFLGGCSAAKAKPDILSTRTDLRVKKITIEGVNNIDLKKLKSGLATQEDPGWRTKVEGFPILGAAPRFFDPILWQRDLERIRIFYKARGFYNAKIVNESINKNLADKSIHIKVKISEGKAVRITAIEIDGLPKKEEKNIRKNLELKRGAVFVQEKYLRAKAKLSIALRNRSYAFAKVRGRVIVNSKSFGAKVLFYVDPGPRAIFGKLKLVGLRSIDEKKVLSVISFKEGDTFSPSELRKTQEAIYDLGVFSLVKLTTILDNGRKKEKEEEEEGDENDLFGDILDQAQDLAEDRLSIDPVVPIVINLSEAKLWNVRVGVGGAAEKSRQDLHLRFDWGSRNFLGGLRRLDHFNSVGYAWAPSFFEKEGEANNQGIIANSVLRFTQPRFFEKKTSLEIKLAVERDVEPGFSILNPSAKFGIRRKFFGHLTLDLSYNFALFILSDINDSLLDSSFDVQSKNVLEYFEQRLLLDYRDDVLNPNSGFSIQLSLQEAEDYLGFISPIVGGDFDYIKPAIDVEMYWPLVRNRIILSFRANAASIYNTRRDKRPPLPQKLYAGGVGSNRAFGRRELSPYSYEGEPIPIGGLTKVGAALEPRFRLQENFLDVGDIWFAPFVDASTVLSGSYLLDTLPDSRVIASPVSTQDVFSSMIFGVGAGAWWLTPIGPLRLDLAYRISSIQNDPRFRRCEVANNSDGSCPHNNFVPLAEDEIQSILGPFNFLLGIGHSF